MSQTCTCGRPTSGAWLCETCATTLSHALVNIAAHYGDLDTVLAKQTRYVSAGKGSIGKAQPLPIDLRFAGELEDGSRLKAETKSTVVTWARTVMDEQPEVHGPVCAECIHVSCAAIKRRRWPRDTVQSLCAYLARQFQYVIRERWAEQILDELLFIETRLTRFVDRPSQRMYLGQCVADKDGEPCGGSVYATEGASKGRCDMSDCDAEYLVKESREGLEEALDSRLCTASEIAHLSTYLGLKADRDRVRKRINQWHTRNRITANGHAENGDPMFTYSDVKALLYAEFAEPA